MRPLARDDIRSAASTLARAFDADPLYRFLLPDAPDRRRRWLELIMTRILFDCVPAGFTHAPPDGPEAGAIAWLPPGGYPPPSRNWSFLWRRRDRPGLALPTARMLTAGRSALRQMARVHPHEPHYYLVAFGVDPDCKGRGLGRQLLSHGLTHADRERVPAYLETSNETNLGMYARFGFEQVDQLDPGRGAPPVWTMRREPR